MQHMVPHLLQTAAIVDLAGDQLTDPKLGRLADMISQQSQAHLQQLQGWLASRGLAPYDPQQDPNRREETDLARLSRGARRRIRPSLPYGHDRPAADWPAHGRG
jgi:uncharacterized protein (DUF305 family)